MQDKARWKPSVVTPSRGSHRRGSLVNSIAPSVRNHGISSELDAHANLREKRKDTTKFSFSYLNEFRAFVPSLFVDHVQYLMESDAGYKSMSAFSHDVFAVIVVADISGFTQLSNKLSIERLKACIK